MAPVDLEAKVPLRKQRASQNLASGRGTLVVYKLFQECLTWNPWNWAQI